MQYITSSLAKVLGITTNTIRRYEECGFLSPQRGENNYRSYNEFDITKAAFFRLYGKCGFSHSEINGMLLGSDEQIIDIYQNKLNDLDAQIERLTRLRHWLKDNKILIETAKKLDNEYIIMKCPPMKYILFSADDTLLSEPDRLASIKTFMYDAPEVQLINVFKYDDILSYNYKPYSGWAIKETDITKFGLEEFVGNCPYIESYPRQECLYYVNRISPQIINDTDKVLKIKRESFDQVENYMAENNYALAGDIVEFFVNAVGDTVTLMECVPIKQL